MNTHLKKLKKYGIGIFLFKKIQTRFTNEFTIVVMVITYIIGEHSVICARDQNLISKIFKSFSNK